MPEKNKFEILADVVSAGWVGLAVTYGMEAAGYGYRVAPMTGFAVAAVTTQVLVRSPSLFRRPRG